MGCHGGRWQHKMERMQDKMERLRWRMEGAGRGDWWGAPRSQRQPRLRRIPHRDAAASGGRAARVPRFPRPPALRQGQDRVRPVHGRAPPAHRRTTAGAAELTPTELNFETNQGRPPSAGGLFLDPVSCDKLAVFLLVSCCRSLCRLISMRGRKAGAPDRGAGLPSARTRAYGGRRRACRPFSLWRLRSQADAGPSLQPDRGAVTRH